MAEQYLYGLALLVPEFPLVVDVQAPPVEAQHLLDLLIEIVFEQKLNIPLHSFHEDGIFDKNS